MPNIMTHEGGYSVPYGGKVSLVPNFAKLLANPSEEIFMILIFTPSAGGDHTHVYTWCCQRNRPSLATGTAKGSAASRLSKALH